MAIQILPPDPIKRNRTKQVFQAINTIADNIEKTKLKKENEQLMMQLSSISREKTDAEGNLVPKGQDELRSEARNVVVEFQKQQQQGGSLFQGFSPSGPSLGQTPVEQAVGGFDVRSLFDPSQSQQSELRGLQIQKTKKELGAFESREELASRGKEAAIGLAEKKLGQFDFNTVLDQNAKVIDLKTRELNNLLSQKKLDVFDRDVEEGRVDREQSRNIRDLQIERLQREVEFFGKEQEITQREKEAQIKLLEARAGSESLREAKEVKTEKAKQKIQERLLLSGGNAEQIREGVGSIISNFNKMFKKGFGKLSKVEKDNIVNSNLDELEAFLITNDYNNLSDNGKRKLVNLFEQEILLDSKGTKIEEEGAKSFLNKFREKVKILNADSKKTDSQTDRVKSIIEKGESLGIPNFSQKVSLLNDADNQGKINEEELETILSLLDKDPRSIDSILNEL